MDEKNLFQLVGEEIPEVEVEKEECNESGEFSLLPKEELIKTAVMTPTFQYADIKEELSKEDMEKTFDDLRKKYAKDFPELEKKDKVNFNIEYGYTQIIRDNKTAVKDVKAKMEKDKRFSDALKKAKKPLQMIVRPRVTGQTKGNVNVLRMQNVHSPSSYDEFSEIVSEIGCGGMDKKINRLIKEEIKQAAAEKAYSAKQKKKLESEIEYFNLKLWEFYNYNSQNNKEGSDYNYSEDMSMDDIEYLHEILFRNILKLKPLRIVANEKYKHYYPKNIA